MGNTGIRAAAKPQLVRLLILAMLAQAALFAGPAQQTGAAIGSGDFLKTDGRFIKNNSGTGEIVTLRGTNAGGWLAQEDWMSPLGEFAADRTGWTASASANGANAGNTLDGSGTSYWDTGANQASGQWLQVNLGAPTLFNRLYVDAAGRPGDYPRGYQIQASDDGTTWRDIASGASTSANTVVRTTPQVAQYVRINQTGTASNWWSVAEFNLFNDPVLNNGGFTATASSTGSGSSAANALDGNVNTRWTSGTAQTGGQTFTINLGGNKEVSRILIDAGPASAGDYARGYEVWGLTDGVWTKYASGAGASRFIHAEFWWSYWMTEIRIVQTGSSSSWWSIADVSVFSGGSLERSGWTLSASSSAAGTSPGNVRDGNAGTVWSTGAAQTSGQWFQVDLGAKITFNQIVLDTAKNTGYEQDYPRGYTVQVSQNGTAWTTVASGQGLRKATPINFPAVGARYIRINQTGSAGNWWSIGELSISLNNDDYSLYSTLGERFGATTRESLYTTHQNTWIVESDIDNIKAMGMNLIRLPIAWFEIVDESGAVKPGAWTNIDWLIAEAAERDMYVLLDLHTVPGGGCPWGSCGRVGPNPNAFWTTTAYQDMVVDIWEAIATRYEGNPAVAGYDLINEPLIDYAEDADDVAQKSAYYDRLYDAVRAIDPDHTIYIAAFFNFNSIYAPSVYGWQNVVYEVHPYDMPGGKDVDAQNALVETTLASVGSIQNDPNWNVPILLGEYSLYHNDDVWAKFMSGLNAMNISWTNWSYKVRQDHYQGAGGYWGFYNSNPNPLPVINNDASATIASKLGAFGTSQFSPNSRFINVVSRFASGEPWMATVPIDMSGWTATASSTESSGSAANAIDWNVSTRWSSGVSQANGQWFQVNMGAKKTFDQISFETGTANKWDYPRGYQVQISNDGASWTTVASGQGFGWKQSIVLGPQYAQYVRVAQTGNAHEWWSISEFHVYSEPSLVRSGWTASASSTDAGDSVGGAIDGSLTTRWSNGAAQANGQFYAVDMGKAQTFNRLLLDTAASAGDYPRGYQIQVSNDGTSWSTVASGTNANAALLVQFPVQTARHIRVVQTGTASSWWSIADLQVYGEKELARAGWTASASQTEAGSSAGNALDASASTRWSGGVPQASGQTFQVDMGASRWFNHIVMDSGASTGDYARGYVIEVSSNGTSWRTVASGEGASAAIAANFPITEARYIRVTLKEASPSWWSISDFRVFE
ncbi:discoidin domain-containing protein [Paenibacillus sp. LHD-117]|uniref:discoidin domain-containing protein n=1 Tax=Paenibacillus sp. LHD-117 TaxID=3071412 RepID=UPI0027E0648E|nr:discoidin domain-containing protein [Paenibacillus sp. LHD-117]MDQ6422704.1 discoidin domain-containing protein [Paenibacillus sp. LHD-117]